MDYSHVLASLQLKCSGGKKEYELSLSEPFILSFSFLFWRKEHNNMQIAVLIIGKQNYARQRLLTSSHSVQCASISREELKAVPLQVKESGATEEKLEDRA